MLDFFFKCESSNGILKNIIYTCNSNSGLSKRSKNLSFCNRDIVIKEAFTGEGRVLFYMVGPQTTIIPCSLVQPAYPPHAYWAPEITNV